MMTLSSSSSSSTAAANNVKSSSNSLCLKRKLQDSSEAIATLETSSTDSSTTLILRKKLCLKKFKSLIEIKTNFIETITEHYFLKLNKNYLDYPEWKLRLQNEQIKEYTDYLNDQLATKNDINLLESKINKSVKTDVNINTLVSINENQTPSSAASSASLTKFKYEYDQNTVHERAKHEASILQRISNLRREGLWSIKRLPKLCEPKCPKAHWDYLLDEMMWMSTDFQQERKWKKAVSKKISSAVQKYFKDKEIKAELIEKEELKRMRKNAMNVAREIMSFWKNVEKVVEYKQKTRDEEKRKKELDMHLNFIVDQTEKYSSRLMKGLSSLAGNVNMNKQVTSPRATLDNNESEYEDAVEEELIPMPVSRGLEDKDEDNDEEYDEANDSDDAIDNESTIESEEDINNYDVDEEIKQLQMESELPLDELIASQYFDEFQVSKQSIEGDDQESDEYMDDDDEEDDDYSDESDMTTDIEDTIEEEENYQQNESYNVDDELKQLEEDSKLPIDDLKLNICKLTKTTQEIESFIDVDKKLESGEEIKIEMDTQLATDEVIAKSNSATSNASGELEQDDKELNTIAAQAQSLQPTGYTLETTNVKTKVPFLLKYSLREYQHVGLDWLVTMYENKLNGILADEMGLGKTIQTIALLAHLAVEKGNWGPHLIVVPTSVMLNWELELKKWCPAFKILTYYGTPKERKLKRQGWTKFNAFHVCITSYKLVTQDHAAFRRKKWKYFILDEAQNIKNFKSQRWQSLLNFQSQRRLLLTGTPLQNNLMELWSLMHFLMPNVFASHREFQQWFSNPLKFMIEGNQEYNEQLIKRLHKVLRPFLLRRLKVDVEKQMPKKYEHIIKCKLSKRQRLLYDEFMSNTKTKQTLNEGNYMSVINVLMQLRKVCNHPDLFDPRPIVSAFVCEPISYETSSLVYNISEDLFDINNIFSNICEMELIYSAFACHRARKLQTTRKQIEDAVLSQTLLSTESNEVAMKEDEEENDKTSFYLDKKLIISAYDLEKRKSLFEIKCLSDKRAARVKQNIQFLVRSNRQRCSLKPVYGQDLQDYIIKLAEPVKLSSFVQDYNWSSGYANCREIIFKKSEESKYYWKHTETLKKLIHLSIDDYYQELKDLILRFVIYISPVKCFNRIKLHCSHPNVSLMRREKILIEEVNQEIHEHLRQDNTCDYMFKIGTLMNTQFPEKRLIQYDCGKLQSLDVLLHRLFVESHRVLLFTQMTRMLDVLENFLNYHGYKYLRLDGSTTIENRQILMERFNNDKRIFCFILSTRSGGVGVNLTGADTVIFYDSDWNPTMDAQAQDRCHRIGQTRDVHIYRLICEKTIEENILKKANQKRLLSEVTIEGGCFTTAVLKKHHIKELFDQPTGLNENELDMTSIRGTQRIDINNDDSRHLIEINDQSNPILDKVNEVVMFADNIVQDVNNFQLSNTISETQFEDALAMVEDETDVLAAKELKAEVVADNAEFDEEHVFLDEETSKKKQADSQDKVESELKSIENELRPIERYALKFLETFGNIAQSLREDSHTIEIEKAKREWELQRLKALKEEEEREAELENEEMMFTYPQTEVINKNNESLNSRNSNSSKKRKASKFVNSISSSSSAATKVTRRASNSKNIIKQTECASTKASNEISKVNSKSSLIENELAKYNKLLMTANSNSSNNSISNNDSGKLNELSKRIIVSDSSNGGSRRGRKVGLNKSQEQLNAKNNSKNENKSVKKKSLQTRIDVVDNDVDRAADTAVADVIAAINSKSQITGEEDHHSVKKIVEDKKSKIKIPRRNKSLNTDKQAVKKTSTTVETASQVLTVDKRAARKSLDTENIYKKPFISYRGLTSQRIQPQQPTIVNNSIITNNTNNYIINNTTNNYTFITTIATNPKKINNSQNQATVAATPPVSNIVDDDDNDLLLTAETPAIDISNLFNFKQFNNSSSSNMNSFKGTTIPSPFKASTTPIAAAALATTTSSINLTSKPIVINKSVFTATTKTTQQLASTLSSQDNRQTQPMKPITTLIKRNNNNNNNNS